MGSPRMTDDSLIEKFAGRMAGTSADRSSGRSDRDCSEHPQLLPSRQEKAAAFAAMDRALRTGQTTLTIPGMSDTSDGNSSAVAKGTSELMLARPRYRFVRFHAKGGLGEVLVAHDGTASSSRLPSSVCRAAVLQIGTASAISSRSIHHRPVGSSRSCFDPECWRRRTGQSVLRHEVH